MQGDRERWDARYRERAPAESLRGHWIEDLGLVPTSGAALELACGAGALACRWAELGLDTTAVDVSPQALQLTQALAASLGVTVRTVALDLDQEPLPRGPFALVSCMHYLARKLWPEVPAQLAPGGVCAYESATVTNLERHAHPSARWLLARGELERSLRALRELDVIYADEDWHGEQHTARVVARKRA